MTSASDQSAYWIVAISNSASSGKAPRSRNKTPAEQEAEAVLTRRELDMKISKLAQLFPFRIPKLRVGTLDRLITMGDELVKLDPQLQAYVKKIQNMYVELKGEMDELRVNNMSPERYVESFAWNSAIYRINLPLPELRARIESDIHAIMDDLSKKAAKYAEVDQELTALERKETGTLLVKPLGPLIDPSDIVERDFLTTLLVVIPKSKENQWISTYEVLEDLAEKAKVSAGEERRVRGGPSSTTATSSKRKGVENRESNNDNDDDDNDNDDDGNDNESDDESDGADKDYDEEDELAHVELSKEQLEEHKKRKARRKERRAKVRNIVPRSSKKLASDSEYVLYRVIVFKKGVGTIKNLCRERRWTVRHYEHDPEELENDKDRMTDLTNKKNRMMASLLRWLENQFSHVLEAWMHIKAIRTFVEAVLRFGIPVNFQAYAIKPRKGYRVKLRKALGELYENLSGGDMTGSEDASQVVDLSGMGTEFYPYVYVPVALGDAET